MWNQQNIFNCMLRQVVLEEEQVWSVIARDGAMHRDVSAVNDAIAESAGTALELVTRCACRTAEVGGVRSRRKRVYPWRFTGRTVKICAAPWFGENPSALGRALVSVEASCWESEVQTGIRSWVTEREKKDAAPKGRRYISRGQAR